jgi:hypothetical protein
LQFHHVDKPLQGRQQITSDIIADIGLLGTNPPCVSLMTTWSMHFSQRCGAQWTLQTFVGSEKRSLVSRFRRTNFLNCYGNSIGLVREIREQQLIGLVAITAAKNCRPDRGVEVSFDAGRNCTT